MTQTSRRFYNSAGSECVTHAGIVPPPEPGFQRIAAGDGWAIDQEASMSIAPRQNSELQTNVAN